MDLANLFVWTALLDGGPFLGKAELVQQLLTLLSETGYIACSEILPLQQAILRREQLGSTGIGRGVAIPHARHAAVERALGILGVCRQPVWFDALDGEPVDILVLILSPPDRPAQHLAEGSLWSEGLSRHLAGAEFCRRLRQACSAEEIEEVVQTAVAGMTRREWLTRTDPHKMLNFVRRRCSFRRLLLFRCAQLRRSLTQAPPLLPADTLDRETANLLERLADGLVGREAVEALMEKRNQAQVAFVAQQDFEGAARNRDWTDVLRWCRRPGTFRPQMLVGRDDLPLLSDLFGDPFRPPRFKRSLLSWHDGLVVQLAQAAYEDRLLPGGRLPPARLAVLADAVEEAGCEDAEMLGHLRGPDPHTRGCHAVDALLGRA